MAKQRLSILALAGFALASCGGGQSPASSEAPLPSSDPVPSISEVVEISSEQPAVEYSRANPRVYEAKADSEDVVLKGPFVILTAEGEEPTLTMTDTGVNSKDVPPVYDDMYKAIRTAGTNSTSKNPLQVQDQNYVQIFIRRKTSQNFVFHRDAYIGECATKVAKSYCDSHSGSYAINGNASDYSYMSRAEMSEDLSIVENLLETNAGAYNYMFSKSGDGALNGFSYVTCDVHLSDAVYRPPVDGGQWNAYIFVNMARNLNCDLGLIGVFNQARRVCEWKMVRNCSSKQHTAGTSTVEHDAKFYVYQDKIVTTSTQYDPETMECSGFDDLHFEVLGMTDGWILNITNMRTGVVNSFTEHHVDSSGNPLYENTVPNNGRALIAASYCPVTGNVWNWNCGAKLENVVFDNIELTRVLSDPEKADDIEAYRDDTLERLPLYPDTDAYKEGYSQGDFVASHEYGIRESDGQYNSGIAYSQGDHYISYTVDYNSNVD